VGTRKARQPARKRPVYVNGTYCESLAAAARKASKIKRREIKLWEIQRIVNGAKTIKGLTVTETPPVKREPPVEARKYDGAPLLRYPHGETPCERGLPRIWR